MPLIARGGGSGDLVTCVNHGAAGPSCFCCMPLTWPGTLECSPNVKIGGFGVVRTEDKMALHMRNFGTEETKCNLHDAPCTEGSPNIFVNGKRVAREYDHYVGDNDHWISGVLGGAVMANGPGGSYTPRVVPLPPLDPPPPPPPLPPFIPIAPF